MIVLNQVLTDRLAMGCRLLKNTCHRVLINVKDPRASSDAIALGERFEHSIDGLLIGVKASEDAVVATTEALTALQTTIKWSALRPVVLH